MRRPLFLALERLGYAVRNPTYLRIREALEASQRWPRERMEGLQDERLARLITHAYLHVPYYRESMRRLKLTPDNIKGREDLRKLPVLTKADLIRHQKELLSEIPAERPAGVRSSGGSTGEPVHVLVDAPASFYESAAYIRGLSFSGYRHGDPIVLLFGGSLGSAKPALSRRFRSWLAGQTLLPAFGIRDDTAAMYADRILASGARFLNGYASAIHILACTFERKGIPIRLEGLFPTSETLYDFQKEKMEEVTGAKTFGVYGCCEVNSIAFECRAHSGFHLTEENIVTEVLHGTEPAPPGHAGSLTLTTLNNFAMPLIRYQNEDVVTLQDGPCSCGRTLGRLGRIHGRVNDLLRATDGTLLSGAFIPYLFKTTDGIREMQVIQEREEQIIVKIVKNERFSQEDLEQRLSLLRRYLGPVNVEVQFVDVIERTPAGKLKSVVSPFGRELLATSAPDARH